MKSGIFERFQSMPIARSSVLWALDAYEAALGDQARAENGGALLGEQGKEDQAEQWYRKEADARRRDG
jgi:hypothetical protein